MDSVETRDWRKTAQIIINGKFEGEALSWKGHDIALLKLYGQQIGDWPPVKILCLPQPGDKIQGENIYFFFFYTKIKFQREDQFCPDHEKLFFSENLLTAGFGRRRNSHCVTDNQGPEKFGICGQPKECSKDHRGSKSFYIKF